ncbi:Unconventional myosin-Ic, partial [Araneus ventricosus]
RNEPENEVNAFFLLNVKSEFLKRLARRLPTSLLDKHWPLPPTSCKEASSYLRQLHRTWLMRKYVKNLSPDRKFQLDQKVFAEELFKGKKSSYIASVPRPFVASRLATDLEGRILTVLENNMQSVKEKIV